MSFLAQRQIVFCRSSFLCELRRYCVVILLLECDHIMWTLQKGFLTNLAFTLAKSSQSLSSKSHERKSNKKTLAMSVKVNFEDHEKLTKLVRDLQRNTSLCRVEDYPGVLLLDLNRYVQEHGPLPNPLVSSKKRSSSTMMTSSCRVESLSPRAARPPFS